MSEDDRTRAAVGPGERLYLIRHGKPADVWGGGDEDPGLDALGREQAIAVARQLLAAPDRERPRAVVSSPLRRCRETAQPLADALGLTVRIEPAVGEIPTPAHLGQSERPDWLRGAFEGDWSQVRGDIDYEDWRRNVARAVSRWPGAAVFSHFVAINAVVSLVTGQKRVVCFRPGHASVTMLRLAEERLDLIALGGEAHTGVL
jgi:broad specificity phosphatase PhoE